MTRTFTKTSLADHLVDGGTLQDTHKRFGT
jgi:hypothetical protein